MTGAVYVAIFLHFARKTIRKISESKYADRPVSTGIFFAKRYMYTENDTAKAGFNIGSFNPYPASDLIRHSYPSIMAKR